MPTKTKKEATKKTSVKKTVAKKAPTKMVEKKVPVAKKKAATKTVVKNQPAIVQQEVMKPIEKIIHRFEKRFVFVPLCDNCNYVPMRINRLVALMSVLVIILSGIIIAQASPIDISAILVNATNTIALR